jgi:hypothetical protein
MNESNDILLLRVLANESAIGNRKSQQWKKCDISITRCTFTKEFQKLCIDSSAILLIVVVSRLLLC